MADVVINRKYLSVTVHATANQTWTIAGNNSVSNVAMDDEVLSGASIKQIWAGSSSGNGAYWTVTRGANVVAVLDSTVWIDYAGNGNMLGKDSAEDLSVTLTNAADDAGYIMIELQKHGTRTPQNY
jgi:hypothetical protein